jgi:putative FmdB family regulatory protein
MPTYEYECTSCGRHIEVFQRITEEPLRTCEACGGQLRKVFHPAGIVFKGSGFYATDSRSSSKPGDGKGDGTGKKDDATKGASGSSSTSGGGSGGTGSGGSGSGGGAGGGGSGGGGSSGSGTTSSAKDAR